MKVGEIYVPEEQDFQHFKIQCTTDEGWTICYDKSTCRVSTKKNSLSTFDLLRVQAEFDGISCELVYDVLHDNRYRPKWDTAMLEGYEVCSVAPNSDIGYYSIKSPPPFKNRDFVTQRYWLDLGHNREKYIMNHSLNHIREPPRKNCVRGISYLTGYLLIPTGPSSCRFYYMTQCDPAGKLPAWVVNKASKAFVPKLIKKLLKACSKYDTWKAKHEPSYKPWLYPEQMNTERLNPDDIAIFDAKETLAISGDSGEAAIGENAVDIDHFGNDD